MTRGILILYLFICTAILTNTTVSTCVRRWESTCVAKQGSYFLFLIFTSLPPYYNVRRLSVLDVL